MLTLAPHVLIWIVLNASGVPVATGSERFDTGPACSSAAGQLGQTYARVRTVCAPAHVGVEPNRLAK